MDKEQNTKKWEDFVIIHNEKNKCGHCDSPYHTIDEWDYCICTNCGFRWR